MTHFNPVCELCGSNTLCNKCRGLQSPQLTLEVHEESFGRKLIHVVKGSPTHVLSEWKRLARMDECPS